MSKYVIEFDDKQLLEYDKDTDTYFRTLFKVKGFNALVFDEEGLEKLTPLDKALDETYQQGLKDAWRAANWLFNNNNVVADVFGLSDDQSIECVFLEYSPSDAIAKIKAYEEQHKVDDEIKVSDIITDGKINYLVTDITDKSYIALQGTDFEPAYIGKDYIKYYHNLHDSKDMIKIAEEINKAVKGEQRNCSVCKHDGDSHFCDPCRHNDMWESEEGE